jgi:hypothetical protein
VRRVNYLDALPREKLGSCGAPAGPYWRPNGGRVPPSAPARRPWACFGGASTGPLWCDWRLHLPRRGTVPPRQWPSARALKVSPPDSQGGGRHGQGGLVAGSVCTWRLRYSPPAARCERPGPGWRLWQLQPSQALGPAGSVPGVRSHPGLWPGGINRPVGASGGGVRAAPSRAAGRRRQPAGLR